MTQKSYFVVNDTRYDNHHGGLRVMANLHLAMEKRGWQCTGSLPVSTKPEHLNKSIQTIKQTDLIIVNGEGSLHHNSRNATRLYNILSTVTKERPIALINALWQGNDSAQWQPLLASFAAIYARDQRSQAELQAIGIDAGYAPDLTFYRYPDFTNNDRSRFLCTDSVLKEWNEKAFNVCEKDSELDFRTLLTRHPRFSRGGRDWGRQLKSTLYPWLFAALKINVPARYKILSYATNDSNQFLRTLAGYQGLCAARYHALCFALQQQVPMLAVSSNSHKNEALLEEVGLPLDQFSASNTGNLHIKGRLQQVVAQYADYADKVVAFKKGAIEKIDSMFDRVVSA